MVTGIHSPREGGSSVMSESVTVEVQPTPNVNAMKFRLSQKVTEGRSQTYRSLDETINTPLAKALFAIPGVVQVFFLNDFITLTRDPGAEWPTIIAQAETVIQRHFGPPR